MPEADKIGVKAGSLVALSVRLLALRPVEPELPLETRDPLDGSQTDQGGATTSPC